MTSTTSTVFSETACILKYDYPKFKMGKPQFVQQIGVAVIKAVHRDHSSPGATFDIQFSHPKGCKPQSSKCPDTLYQDIDADMSFKMNHTSKKGKMRVSDISKQLQKNVLLAFNQQIQTLFLESTVSRQQIQYVIVCPSINFKKSKFVAG